MSNRIDTNWPRWWRWLLSITAVLTLIPISLSITGCEEEPCDGVDNDGDGQIDEGYDQDGDGFLDANACSTLPQPLDCDDTDPTINPAALESCTDAIDNNCNGTVDEEQDRDGDGFGSCSGDCDDANPERYPDAIEHCDDIDQDCDGIVDDVDEDGLSSPSCTDDDGDGLSEAQGDCLDSDPAVHPGSVEQVADSLDNNCDGIFEYELTVQSGGMVSVGHGPLVGVTVLIEPGSIALEGKPSGTGSVHISIEQVQQAGAQDSAVVVVGAAIDLHIVGTEGEVVRYNPGNPPELALTYDPMLLVASDEDEQVLDVCYFDDSGICRERVYEVGTDPTPDGVVAVYISHTSVYGIARDTLSFTLDGSLPLPLLSSAGQTSVISLTTENMDSNSLLQTTSLSPFLRKGSLDVDGDGTSDIYNGNYDLEPLSGPGATGTFELLIETDIPGRYPLALWTPNNSAYIESMNDFRKTTRCDEVSLHHFTYSGNPEDEDVLDYWATPDSFGYLKSYVNGEDSLADIVDCISVEVRPFVSGIRTQNETRELQIEGDKAENPAAIPWVGEAPSFDEGENLSSGSVETRVFSDAGCLMSVTPNPIAWTLLDQAPQFLTYSLLYTAGDGTQTRALPSGSYYIQVALEGAMGSTQSACIGPVRVALDLDQDGATDDKDCDDNDPLRCSDPNLTACQERCDGIDNDCNSITDDHLSEPLATNQTGVCAGSEKVCAGVTGWQEPSTADIPGYSALEGTGDGIDSNCDGKEVCYGDGDKDGYRPTTGETVASSDSDCSDPGEASASTPAGDCNDTNANINPAAQEQCNTLDDDCDGLIDDADPSTSGTTSTWYRDQDADGYGDPAQSTRACTQPTGYVSNSQDCNDANASIRPNATEGPGDGIDQNCDGRETCYQDTDRDGYRTESTVSSSDMDCTDAGEASSLVPGKDCNDGRNDIHPGAPEGYGDEVDQNCDGQEVCYKDGDNDGYRPDSVSTVASSDTDCQDSGEAKSNEPTGDCRDDVNAIRPNATEGAGDGVDQNCDGLETCYQNDDNDGYRDGTTLTSQDTDCADSGEAYASKPAGDCDDGDPYQYPGAPERCNGYDDDCDGTSSDDAGQVSVGNSHFGSSIQNAVNAISSGTINVCSGTYAPFSMTSKSSITVRAFNGANTVRITGGSCGGIHLYSVSAITLDGLKVDANSATANGDECSRGAGIYVKASNPVYIQNGDITNNHALANGGGLWVGDSTVYVTNVDFVSNVGDDKGAGIYVRGASYVRLENSTINSHLANAGLYIRDTDGTPSVYVKNSGFCNNESNDIKFDSGTGYDWDTSCSTLKTLTCSSTSHTCS